MDIQVAFKAITDYFRPSTDKSILDKRKAAVGIGAAGLVGAIAMKIIGKKSTLEIFAVAIFSAVVLTGGIIGSVGLIAVPIIIAAGLCLGGAADGLLAFPMVP